MKNKFVLLSVCLVALASIAIALANQNSGIEVSNSDVVKTPITKEYASNAASKLLPVDKAKINLRNYDKKSYWEFIYLEGKHATIVNIDANTGWVTGFFNSSKIGNNRKCV